jgi:general secretion pathway protein J
VTRTIGPIRDIRAQGFTLLEVLVALVICGFIMISLSQGLRFSVLAGTASGRMTRGNDDLDTADRVIRHLIEGMDPGTVTATAPMTGRHDRFECISAMPGPSGVARAGQIHAELLVEAGQRLALRWHPWLHARQPAGRPAPRETELLRGITGMTVFYWKPGGPWVDAWSAADLPTLIRVRLQFPEGDARHWPDIVAAPGLDRR